MRSEGATDSETPCRQLPARVFSLHVLDDVGIDGALEARLVDSVLMVSTKLRDVDWRSSLRSRWASGGRLASEMMRHLLLNSLIRRGKEDDL
jgi:hypothetical protein